MTGILGQLKWESLKKRRKGNRLILLYKGLNVSNVCTKANRTLGFLRRNLYSCPKEVKEAAYKGLVRPVLDYGSSVWD